MPRDPSPQATGSAKTPLAVLEVLLDAVRAAVPDEEFRAGMARSLLTVACLEGPGFANARVREVKRVPMSVRFIGKTDE